MVDLQKTYGFYLFFKYSSPFTNLIFLCYDIYVNKNNVTNSQGGVMMYLKKQLLLLILCVGSVVIAHDQQDMKSILSAKLITEQCKTVWKIPAAGCCGLFTSVPSALSAGYHAIDPSKFEIFGKISCCFLIGGFVDAASQNFQSVDYRKYMGPVLVSFAFDSVWHCKKIYPVLQKTAQGSLSGFQEGCVTGKKMVDEIDLQKKYGLAPVQEAALWATGTTLVATATAGGVYLIAQSLSKQ